MLKKAFVIHPFLFAIFPVLFLYSHNMGEASFFQALLATGVMLGLTPPLLFLSRLVVRDRHKAAILVSIFWFFVLVYGQAFNLIKSSQIGDLIGRHRYLLPLWGILFSAGGYLTIKTQRVLSDFTKILNVVSLSLVAIPLFSMLIYVLTLMSVNPEKSKDMEPIEISTLTSSRPSTLPDIYYIILDRYGSQRTLREFYDFDNSEFIDYLSRKGFYVATKSKCNYPTTYQSLASSLNMEYIGYPTTVKGIIKIIEDHKVGRFMRLNGYKFIHFGSWWGPTSKNKYADMNVNWKAIPEFLKLLYENSIFCPISAKLGLYDIRPTQWERVLYKFSELSKIPEIKEPTFTFVHMIFPHGPIVFDRNGKFVTREEIANRHDPVNYVNQLVFANKKVKEVIDKLLSDSENPPIIILQADEGPLPQRIYAAVEEDNFDWTQITKAETRQMMGILNAYYLPGVNKSMLYPSITPVNSFRVVLNLYFKTNLKLLADRNYFYRLKGYTITFFDVTDAVALSYE